MRGSRRVEKGAVSTKGAEEGVQEMWPLWKYLVLAKVSSQEKGQRKDANKKEA